MEEQKKEQIIQIGINRNRW